MSGGGGFFSVCCQSVGFRSDLDYSGRLCHLIRFDLRDQTVQLRSLAHMHRHLWQESHGGNHYSNPCREHRYSRRRHSAWMCSLATLGGDGIYRVCGTVLKKKKKKEKNSIPRRITPIQYKYFPCFSTSLVNLAYIPLGFSSLKPKNKEFFLHLCKHCTRQQLQPFKYMLTTISGPTKVKKKKKEGVTTK